MVVAAGWAGARAMTATSGPGISLMTEFAGMGYFAEIPGASDEWWALLVGGVRDLWGDRSLVHSGLPPVHRLVGWLVEHDRRDDAASVVRWLLTLDAPAPREGDHLVVPARVLDVSTVDPAALALREHER